jgi:hypothetical protein
MDNLPMGQALRGLGSVALPWVFHFKTSHPERSAPHYSRWLRNGTAWPISKNMPLTARTGMAVVM